MRDATPYERLRVAARKLADRTIEYVEPLCEEMECDVEMHALATEVIRILESEDGLR